MELLILAKIALLVVYVWHGVKVRWNDNHPSRNPALHRRRRTKALV